MISIVQYKTIADGKGSEDEGELLFNVLSQAEFRSHFEPHINFEMWARRRSKKDLPLRKRPE